MLTPMALRCHMPPLMFINTVSYNGLSSVKSQAITQIMLIYYQFHNWEYFPELFLM